MAYGVNKSINLYLNSVTASIEHLESNACKEVRKFLVSLGLKQEFAEMYTVNHTGCGEWILDTVDNSYGLASVDIIVDDKLTLDDMRMLASHILTDEQLAEIGL